MTIHLLVLGRRKGDGASPPDLDMDDVEQMIVTTAKRFVRRCDRPSELVPLVESVFHDHGPVELLDIYDHGAGGKQMLGSGALFESDSNPASPLLNGHLAEQLAPLLAETAQVRLLGCRTAKSVAGRMLVLKVARALSGRRIVFGTIDGVEVDDFDATGFAKHLDRVRLYSSPAALDDLAPLAGGRLRNLASIDGAH